MTCLAIDLYCGLGGWAEGFLAEGYNVIGFDVDRWTYPGRLVLQDVRTLHGSQFRNATVIVASPPCQGYNYRAMPWKRAKALPPLSNELFDACFRIQREACEAAGRHIPMVVENVKGAQPWVGRAKWHYGSYYLWGDVPALMPFACSPKVRGQNWNRFKQTGEVSPHWRLQSKNNGNGSWFGKSHGKKYLGQPGNARDGIKLRAPGHYTKPGSGPDWFDCGPAAYGSGTETRKMASAVIAKIPFPLSLYLAKTFKQMSP
jgi:hypothetical protein